MQLWFTDGEDPEVLEQAVMRQRQGERGQAAVESAIVLPLFVFIILGTLQLGLMHQARLVTKYAAYKAVRVGALNNARKSKMEDAALAVLLPLLSHDAGGGESIKPIQSPVDFATKWAEYKDLHQNLMTEAPLKFAEVTICGPTSSEASSYQKEIDFDDPQAAQPGGDWEPSELTKLRVQVTLNYRMPIPFANWVIWSIWQGQQIFSGLRVGNSGANMPPTDLYGLAAQSHVYVIPIRANYAMRMQSNVFIDELPGQNDCQIPWSKR